MKTIKDLEIEIEQTQSKLNKCVDGTLERSNTYGYLTTLKSNYYSITGKRYNTPSQIAIKPTNRDRLNKLSIFFLILSVMFILPMVKADLGNFDQNICVPIRTSLNASSVTLATVTLPSPNNTILIINSLMSKSTNYTFNYTFCNTTVTGVYVYDYYDNNGNSYVNSFTITPKTDGLFRFDTNNILGIVLLVIDFIVIVLLIIFRKITISGVVILLTGIILFTNTTYTLVSIFIVITGLVLMLIGDNT